jgi:uncharacterized protein
VKSTLLEQDPHLDAIVRRLIECYQPVRIYLFGSVARGDSGPDSDYDLFVLVPDDAAGARRSSALFYENQLGLSRGADVLVATRESFDAKAARVVASLPATVLREGQLLYAA